jgi:hypothetical protein
MVDSATAFLHRGRAEYGLRIYRLLDIDFATSALRPGGPAGANLWNIVQFQNYRHHRVQEQRKPVDIPVFRGIPGHVLNHYRLSKAIQYPSCRQPGGRGHHYIAHSFTLVRTK